MRKPKINTADNLFHNGDLATGEPGTIVTAEWLNAVQYAFEDVDKAYRNVVKKDENGRIRGNLTANSFFIPIKGEDETKWGEWGANSNGMYFGNSKSGCYLSFKYGGNLTYNGNDVITADMIRNVTDSASTITVASSRAVKLAYDRANTANGKADRAIKNDENGSIAGNLTVNEHFIRLEGSDRYGEWGSNAHGMYFGSNRSKRFLSFRNDGNLTYNGEKVLTIDDFSGELAGNGWSKLPNGLVLQWGFFAANVNDGANVVNYNITFNECFKVFITDYSVADNGLPIGILNKNKTSFKVSGGGSLYWFAIGR